MFRVPPKFAVVAFSASNLAPAVVPPIEMLRLPVEFCVYEPESVRIPVLPVESPGITIPLDRRFPLMDPTPNREPPVKVTPPEADNAPSSLVVPEFCKLAAPPTVKVLPVPMAKFPAFVKLPTVVKVRPPATLKLPVDALVAKFARPSVLVVELRIFDEMPVSVIFAAFVAMLAPAN
jgi:hypothetical protein